MDNNIIFKSIIDHCFDSFVVLSKENRYLMADGQCKTREISTGVKLLVLCKDRSKQWIHLKDLKEPNPMKVNEYTKAMKFDTEPAFC